MPFRPWIPACLGSLLLAFLIYHPCLGFGWVADDRELALQPVVQEPGWLAPWRTGLNGTWRPLRLASYQLDAALFGKGNAAAHHAVNLLLHAACGALVFLLGCRHLKGAWPAALAAALFLAHPVQVESVAWISGRKEVLGAALALLGILLFDAAHAGPRPRRRAAATLCLLAACLAREGAVAAFGVVAAEGWLLGGAEARRLLFRRLALPAAGAALFVAAYLALSPLDAVKGTVWQEGARLRVMPPLWGRALRLLVLPLGLRSHVEDLAASGSWIGAGLWLGGLGVLGGLLLRQGASRARWLLLSGILAYLPASNLLLGLRVPFAEHYLYLGMPFFALGVGAMAGGLPLRRLLPAAGLLLALSMALSAARLPVWAGEVPFWSAAHRQDPRTARLELNLASALGNAGRLASCGRHLDRVLPRLGRGEARMAALADLGLLRSRLGDSPGSRSAYREAADLARALGRTMDADRFEALGR